MNTVILSTLAYGAETWTLTKYLPKRLVAAQRHVERFLLNISLNQQIKIYLVRKSSQIKNTIQTVVHRQGKWT